MTPIQIDLRNLTQAHVDAAMPHMGACSYTSPCIIGTLMTEEQRSEVEKFSDKEWNQSGSVDNLVCYDLLQFASVEQHYAAQSLQDAFDRGQRDHFLRLAKPWLEAMPCS